MHRSAAFVLVCFLTLAADASPYEAPQWTIANVLPTAEQSGSLFRVVDPVTTDGLMPLYRLDTQFGPMTAYGHAQLENRLRELNALEVASATTDLDVIAGTTKRRIEGTLKTVAGAARNPVGLVQSLPRGIVNLFRGTAAQAREWGRDARNATSDQASQDKSAKDKHRLESAASRYADRYLGISAGERAWFERLGVDPYTDNVPLRRVAHHLANVEAATSLGLRLASLPSIPYSGDLARVMDAVYHEDPAVLRERRRDTLLGYGLNRMDIDQFENATALSPTRQLRLVTAAATLHDVTGLDGFFRQAAQLQSIDEAELYVASVEHLSQVHPRHPLSHIITSLHLPGALYADGSGCIVVAAAESIYWTALFESGETALRTALPKNLSSVDLWVTGYVSDEATRQLTLRGWTVRPYAFDDTTSLPVPHP
jgi:hypothetical protein